MYQLSEDSDVSVYVPIGKVLTSMMKEPLFGSVVTALVVVVVALAAMTA